MNEGTSGTAFFLLSRVGKHGALVILPEENSNIENCGIIVCALFLSALRKMNEEWTVSDQRRLFF